MSTLPLRFLRSEGVRLAAPAAAFEVLGYLCVVGVGALCFLFGWLTPNAAAVLTVLLLSSLIVLAWKRFDQGRHPCFLFLCMLMLFQCGRLVGYCLGDVANPFRIELMNATPFDVTRDEAGLVLLSIALSAICIYAPCRWNFQPVAPPSSAPVRRYLPYLYILFFCSLPFQLAKNYLYLRYAQRHGGYLTFFIDYSGLAASVPWLIRLISLVALPVFVAIFVFETRKKWLWTAAILYLATATLYLLTGSRMDTFGLILALWYVARVKSTKRASALVLALLAAGMIFLATVIQSARFGSADDAARSVNIVRSVAEQGISLDITEVAIKYRPLFQPYVGSYLLHDLQGKFVSSDVSNYVRGWSFGFDVSAFLNPGLFRFGFGTGGAYLADTYLMGGLYGVAALSLIIGVGLRLLYTYSASSLGLFVVAAVLPDVLMMPRGGLLVWTSALLKTAIVVFPLIVGWWIFDFLIPCRRPLASEARP